MSIAAGWTGHGVPLAGGGADSIVTAARATAVLLAESEPRPRVAMVIGGPGLARELREVGLKVVPPTTRGLDAAPDALVVGVDFSLSYERLSFAAEAVRRGARFVATNRDPIFPAEDHLKAGAGAIVAAVAVAAGREPDVVVGKPEPLPVRDSRGACRHARARRDRHRRRPADRHPRRERGRGTLGADAHRRHDRGRCSSGRDDGVRPTAVATDAAELERILADFTP